MSAADEGAVKQQVAVRCKSVKEAMRHICQHRQDIPVLKVRLSLKGLRGNK
jgi:hypothetical protein